MKIPMVLVKPVHLLVKMELKSMANVKLVKKFVQKAILVTEIVVVNVFQTALPILRKLPTENVKLAVKMNVHLDIHYLTEFVKEPVLQDVKMVTL